MQSFSRLVGCSSITVTLKETQRGGCFGEGAPGEVRDEGKLCWGYKAGRVEEGTNVMKKRWA